MDNKGTIKRVLKYIKPYRFLLVMSVLMAAVNVIFVLYLPVESGHAIDCIVGVGEVDFTKIKKIIVVMAAVIITAAVSQWIMNVCNNKIVYGVIRDVRKDAMEKIEVLPLGYLDIHPYGEIVSRIIADTDQFADGLLMGFTQLFTGVITIFGTLIFMLTVSVKITLVVVLVTPLSLVMARFIANRTHSMFMAQSAARASQTAIIDEMVGHQKAVKAYNYEERAINRFDEINNQLEKVSLKAIFFSSLTNPVTRFVNSVVYTGVGLTGALSVVKNVLTVGKLTCLLSYANQYTKPFNEISSVITELQNAIVCAHRVFELIDADAQVPDANPSLEPDKVDGNIKLENVYFSYVPDRKLIEDLSLEVKAGKKIAIVGPTGCGKTTLINLLMRFYDVNSGAVKVESIDIRDMKRSTLRKSFGMVLQDTWLRSGTIRENLIMGKPEATEDEIIAAAKAAHAHGFIKRLPNGYDTVMGEDGGSLSQGQKQLLCIARVMLCLPPMLILDEATSSIDTRTEIKIQEAFAAMMAGRTTFIVAHRLSTIKNADTILVMNDGHVIEKGNHKELMAAGGFYMKLYNSQFKG